MPPETRSYDEQYRWLRERTDAASDLEREFLDYLHDQRLRLPDHAQYSPEVDLFSQPDFFYERNGLRGVCVFADGPAHDQPERAERDRQVREALADKGYRVVVLRYDQPIAKQVAEAMVVFRK